MTTQSGLTNTFQALPNPRGGAVRIAEMALTDALHAFMREGDTLGVLRRGIGALHSAGWLPAQRFGEHLGLFGNDVEPEYLDRHQAVARGLIGAKNGTKSADTDLVQHPEGAECWRRRECAWVLSGQRRNSSGGS